MHTKNKLPLLLFFIALLLPISSYAQKKPKYKFNDSRVADADSLRRIWHPEEALTAYKRALQEFEKENNLEGQVYAMYGIMEINRINYNDSIAKTYFDKAIPLAKTRLEPNHVLLSRLYYEEGRRNAASFNTNKAIAYIDSAHWVYSKSVNSDSILNLRIINHKFYQNYYGASFQNRDTALKYLDIRKEIYEEANLTENDNWFYLLEDYAILFRKWGDYDRALSYAMTAASLFDKSPEKYNPEIFYSSNFEISAAAYLSGKYELGYATILKLINQRRKDYGPDDLRLNDFYNVAALNLNNLGRFDSALYYSNKGIQLIEDNYLNDNEEGQAVRRAYWTFVANQGIIYQDMEQYDKAESIFLKALNGVKKDLSDNAQGIIEKYRFLGSLYASAEKHELSIQYYDSAIRYVSNFEPLSVAAIDDKETLIALGTSIRQKVELFHDNRNTELLKEVISETDTLFESVQYLRSSFEGNENKLELSQSIKPFLEAAIEACFELYAQTGEELLIESALQNMSRGKSLLMLDQLGEYSLITDEKIPRSLSNDFAEAKAMLDQLDAKLTRMIKEDFLNDSIKVINLERMEWQSRYENLKKVIVEKYKNKALEESQADLTIDEIVQTFSLNNERAYIEYFVGEKNIYAVMISTDKKYFHRITKTDDYTQSLQSLLSQLSDKSKFTSDPEQSLKSFSENSHQVYSVLVAPLFAEMPKPIHSVVITPDEDLRKLPFDLLLDRPAEDGASFKNLDYLIRQYNISYSFSAKHSVKRRNKARNTILGFGFSDKTIADERSSLGGLPGAVHEIEYLKNNFSGEYFVGDVGTKQLFIDKAQEHGILHLAIHGKSDTLDRFNSVLIFNGLTDYTLRASDLYGAKLNSAMVVLSACETGIGRISKGEGMFSIARGFATAGVPSIVTTLWKVNDEAGSKITESFYEYVKNGLPKDEALRLAKLDYLSSSNNISSIPYFWGNYIHIGDSSAINISPKTNLGWVKYLIIGLALILGGYVLKKPIRKSYSGA